MFEKDEFGRIWFDEDNFLAPFGYFKEDYNFVIKYLRDPFIAERTFYDGLDESTLLSYYSDYLKNGFGWIGFHKKQRAAYLFLETVSLNPLIYAVHGGLDRKLFGRGQGAKSMQFVKKFVFDGMEATKLEGYVLKPNSLVAGYYRRGGLTKECEIQGRVSVDGKLLPCIIYSLNKENYFNKENDYGRFTVTTKRAKPGRSSGSTNSRSKGRTRKNKASKRRGRKSFSKRKRNNR